MAYVALSTVAALLSVASTSPESTTNASRDGWRRR
jgi:hypothetical protein